MPTSEEHPASRHPSIKRARSISASLKGLFKPSTSSVNIANHNKNIYSNNNNNNNIHDHPHNNTTTNNNNNKSGTTSPVLAPIRTTENRGRRKSLNDSRLNKIAQIKTSELQNTRNNTPNPTKIQFPLPQSAMAKLSGGFPNQHVNNNNTSNINVMSPVSMNSEVSPSQTPRLSKNGHYYRHNTVSGNPNLIPANTPLSPIHLPNIEKLSLSELPSGFLYSQDSILSEEDLDAAMTNTTNDDRYREEGDGDATTDNDDSLAPTPKRFTIDSLLENKDRSRRPSRTRSLRKVNSASSSTAASVASSTTANDQIVPDQKMYRRAHADSISASSFPRYQRSSSPHGSTTHAVPCADVTCILQSENFKVFSNGTHEHCLKTISLVNAYGESNNKSKGGFSFSGFFKVGASNKNLDERMESFDTSESSDNLNIDDATSLIPYHKKNFYARISTSSSSVEDDEGETLEDSDHKKKRKSDHGIPEVINPKAAVSSEELKLINTLSEKIHAGLKNAPKPGSKIRRRKSDSSSHDSTIGSMASPETIKLPFVEEYGKMIGTIGHGAYGVVSVCSRPMKDTDVHPLPTFSKDNKLYFAVKHLKPRPNESVEKFSTKITSEFIIGHSLSRPHKKGDKISPNISKVIDLLEINEKFVEVMEFCPSGDLYSLLTRKYKNGTALHPLEADCFMKQLLHGIKYMHDRGIAHCDLKPENILFHPNGLLKICDFGTSCVFQTAWEKHVHFQKGAMGSEPYVAPEEFISGKDYDPRLADCWSIAVVYCTMVLGRYLWKIAVPEKDSFYKSFVEELTNENEFYVLEELRHINHDINRMRRVVLYKMFQVNPEKRISINQILQSSWMKRTRCCIPYKV